MNLRNLSDEALLVSTREAAAGRRVAHARLLCHLFEVNRRTLFAHGKHDSLYAYCLADLNMSEGAASRFSNGVLVMVDVPELGERVISGELSMTAISYAARAFKREAKAGIKFTRERKREIVAKLGHLPSREAQRVLLAESSLPPEVVKESLRIAGNGVTEIKFGAERELMSSLETLRQAWGCSTFKEVFAKMAEVSLASLAPQVPSTCARTLWSVTSGSRYVPVELERQVRFRDQNRCTWKDPVTGEVCGSRHRTQVDHIVPFARGGVHSLENMRVLCFHHNQRHGVACFGEAFIAYSRKGT